MQQKTFLQFTNAIYLRTRLPPRLLLVSADSLHQCVKCVKCTCASLQLQRYSLAPLCKCRDLSVGSRHFDAVVHLHQKYLLNSPAKFRLEGTFLNSLAYIAPVCSNC